MEIIKRYFPYLTDSQQDKILQLQDLYRFWNQQINVISRKDIENLYINHVLHSLSIAKLISFKNQTEVLDVGTGGGFPGIPLAICFPCVRFHLVDSIGKKVKVVQAVASALRLANVECTQIRAETLPMRYDFVVSRAVAALPDFFTLTRRLIVPDSFNSLSNGILYLKGGSIEDESSQLPKKVICYPISDWFEEEYFLQKYILHIPLGNKPKESKY
jgi:16S rRNA (guanine527-N7)-methyltransferase